jgi:hypothetical protein
MRWDHAEQSPCLPLTIVVHDLRRLPEQAYYGGDL